MKTNKTYDEHLAKLNALKEEMLDIKRDPTAAERKAEAEYAVAFKDMLHTGMPQTHPRKNEWQHIAESQAARMLCFTRYRHRSAITAITSKSTVGNMQAFMPMKLLPARRTTVRIFNGYLPNAEKAPCKWWLPSQSVSWRGIRSRSLKRCEN